VFILRKCGCTAVVVSNFFLSASEDTKTYLIHRDRPQNSTFPPLKPHQGDTLRTSFDDGPFKLKGSFPTEMES
jgi:hypothetical protein